MQRQSNRRLTGKTNGFSKEINWFEKQLWLSTAYYHKVLPHDSLQQRLEVAEPTRGSAGVFEKWLPVIPAMAANIIYHVSTTAKLLSYRVPAQFLDQLPKIKPFFTLLDEVHQDS